MALTLLDILLEDDDEELLVKKGKGGTTPTFFSFLFLLEEGLLLDIKLSVAFFSPGGLVEGKYQPKDL
jgi:hypothetical protein